MGAIDAVNEWTSPKVSEEEDTAMGTPAALLSEEM
jgi:hypothetical protein